jgi:sugar transferase (PEP-CTERM/EpsH1 system associated)
VRDLLYLVHRIPYPPNKGDKIRSWNILVRLAERYRVHLGCFVDDPEDWAHVETVRAVCAETRFERLSPLAAKARGAVRALGGMPLSVGYYHDAGFGRWIDRVVRDNAIDTCLVYSSQMAQYVNGPHYAAMRRVIDFVDVDSQKWRQYATMKPWPANWIYRWEADALLRYDRRIACDFDAGLFVSEAEAQVFRDLAPESAEKIVSMHNGVDLVFFDPAAAIEPVGLDRAASLVFTGAMDYWANVDAVTWFVEEILPAVRAQVPAATLYIVGSNPAPAVRALTAHDGVTVTGRVADVRPYLAECRAVIAPMRVARGIQNKVLEAMAMAKPVIATSDAIEGINAESGRHVQIADTPETFSGAVVGVLNGTLGADLPARARDFVERKFGWNASLDALDTLLDGERPTAITPTG